MSQCVPSWDLDDNPTPPRLAQHSHTNSNLLDYEVAELTWENGQLAMHGLGPPRVYNKPLLTPSPATKYTWEKPGAGGTLESIVNQATCLPHSKPAADELPPWFNHARAATASATMAMDALVPCSAGGSKTTNGIGGTSGVGCSTRVGSCSGTNAYGDGGAKRASVGAAPAQEWSSRDNSVSGSDTFGRGSQQVTLDTCERELGAGGFTSTSMGSRETTRATTDDHDSACHSRPQREAREEEGKKKTGGKSSTSTKRSKAAAIHNQSERKRRDKINQRMKTLQKLVPNSSKTDKASMLDEVIEYLKQLQAQVQMISRMNMSTMNMMLPMTLQQQLQLSMMGMGMGMGMGPMVCMDINAIGRPNLAGIPPVLHPAATPFMPVTGAASWDGSAADPLSTFLACQSQPMTMDAYTRMAAVYQQLHHHPASGPKN